MFTDLYLAMHVPTTERTGFALPRRRPGWSTRPANDAAPHHRSRDAQGPAGPRRSPYRAC